MAAAGGPQAAGVPSSHLLHSLYSRNPAMFAGQQQSALAAWASSNNSNYRAAGQEYSSYNHRAQQQEEPQRQDYAGHHPQQQQQQQPQQQPQNSVSNNGYTPQQGCNCSVPSLPMPTCYFVTTDGNKQQKLIPSVISQNILPGEERDH